MRADVFFAPSLMPPADVSNRVVAVVDVLRASTSIAVAIANGARAVIPFPSSEEVVSRSKTLTRSEVRLAGERKSRPISGFDLGNSPFEFTPEAVEGKTVLMSTTNGTNAVLAAHGGNAKAIVVASYVNFSAVLAMLRAAMKAGSDVAILCAGQDRQFSLEDAACAGLFIQHITAKATKTETNDAAQAAMVLNKKYGTNLKRMFKASSHGQHLIAAGFEKDLDVCADLNAFGVLPVYTDRQIVKLATDKSR